jgi:hypothetical protein
MQSLQNISKKFKLTTAKFSKRVRIYSVTVFLEIESIHNVPQQLVPLTMRKKVERARVNHSNRMLKNSIKLETCRHLAMPKVCFPDLIFDRSTNLWCSRMRITDLSTSFRNKAKKQRISGLNNTKLRPSP